MPVSVESSVSGPFLPNGVTTAFAFGFKALAADEVIVVDQDGAELSSALYSVTVNPGEGGTVTFSSPPQAADYDQLFVVGDPAMTQTADFGNAGPSFNPAALTRAIDRAAIRDLKQQVEIDRAVKLPFGESGVTLPFAGARMGKFAAFDASGDLVMSSGTGADAGLRDDLTAGGYALIGNGASALDEIIVKTPREFGATGAGDDLLPLQAFLDALGDGVHGRWEGGPFTISARLDLLDKDNFQITGQCTIKMADAAPDLATHSVLRVDGCTDFLVEGLTADGNRDNRTPAATGGFGVAIHNCHDGVFRRCIGINSPTDNFYFRGADVADIDTYPTDITLEDCEGHNAYRNNVGVVGAVRPKIIRGRYTGANGAEPMAGIDLEPNTNDIHGVLDPLIDGAEVSDNDGAGIFVTGNTGFSVTERAILRNITGRGNKGLGLTSGVGAFVHLSASEDCVVEGFTCHDHPDFAPTGSMGLIEISSNALGATVRNGRFVGITTADAQASCIHPNSAQGVEISNIRLENIACGAVAFAANDGTLQNITVTGSTFTGISIAISGSRNTARALKVDDHAGTYSIYATSPFLTARDWKVQDGVSAVAQIRFDASCTNADIDGLKVHATAAVPSGHAVRIDAAPDSLRNVRATKDAAATGSWTTSNLVFSSLGLFANTSMSGFQPELLSTSGTYDPASLAAGTGTSTTFNLNVASPGDRVSVTPPYDTQGVTYNARVTANGTITLYLFNPTAGAIDLGSGSWKFALLKA